MVREGGERDSERGVGGRKGRVQIERDKNKTSQQADHFQLSEKHFQLYK